MNESKFIGALVGTHAGDALGMPIEGWRRGRILAEFGPEGLRDMLEARLGTGTYTDDTEMMIAVAESLVSSRGFDGQDMARRFVENYHRNRGYGHGTVLALKNIKRGIPWSEAGKDLFGPGQGSFGNGSAMRIAPIGVVYYDRPEELREVAVHSSRITHAHPLGMEGGALQALAIAQATGLDPTKRFDPGAFITSLKKYVRQPELTEKLNLVSEFIADEPSIETVIDELGVDSRVHCSVPAAIYSFLSHDQSFEEAVVYAVSLGGDTDTIGAMTGAIAGAYHGVAGIPRRWYEVLENGEKGRGYIEGLAQALWALHMEL